MPSVSYFCIDVKNSKKKLPYIINTKFAVTHTDRENYVIKICAFLSVVIFKQ